MYSLVRARATVCDIYMMRERKKHQRDFYDAMNAHFTGNFNNFNIFPSEKKINLISSLSLACFLVKTLQTSFGTRPTSTFWSKICSMTMIRLCDRQTRKHPTASMLAWHSSTLISTRIAVFWHRTRGSKWTGATRNCSGNPRTTMELTIYASVPMRWIYWISELTYVSWFSS